MEKSIGIPASIGLFGGDKGIGIDISLGIDLIAPKAEINASAILGGKGVLEVDADAGIDWMNNLAGIEAGIPLSPYQNLKLGVFGKTLGEIESRVSGGIYLKMGVVYVVVPIAIGIYYAINTGDVQTAIEMIRQYWDSLVSSGCIE